MLRHVYYAAYAALIFRRRRYDAAAAMPLYLRADFRQRCR